MTRQASPSAASTLMPSERRRRVTSAAETGAPRSRVICAARSGTAARVGTSERNSSRQAGPGAAARDRTDQFGRPFQRPLLPGRIHAPFIALAGIGEQSIASGAADDGAGIEPRDLEQQFRGALGDRAARAPHDAGHADRTACVGNHQHIFGSGILRAHRAASEPRVPTRAAPAAPCATARGHRHAMAGPAPSARNWWHPPPG